MRLVDLIDSKYDRYTSSRSMVDRFDSLWHDIIVGSHNDNRDIRHLAPRARMAVKASWPGVSRNVIRRPLCNFTL